MLSSNHSKTANDKEIELAELLINFI